MNTESNELNISRLIEAAPAKVWKAWSTPEHLAKWWIPGPVECKVVRLDLRPGGGFETLMREPPGAFQPHVEACFLDIVPERRLVWTTNLAEDWRPAEPPLALTAIITFEERDQKTLYSARVLHRNAAERLKHEEMGFQEGWEATIDQLATFAKRLEA